MLNEPCGHATVVPDHSECYPDESEESECDECEEVHDHVGLVDQIIETHAGQLHQFAKMEEDAVDLDKKGDQRVPDVTRVEQVAYEYRQNLTRNHYNHSFIA